MITKYKTHKYTRADLIQKISITRETEHSVFWSDPKRWEGKEQREAKHCTYQDYWSTWDEAYAYLLTKANNSISYAKENLADAEDDLEKVMELKETE